MHCGCHGDVPSQTPCHRCILQWVLDQKGQEEMTGPEEEAWRHWLQTEACTFCPIWDRMMALKDALPHVLPEKTVWGQPLNVIEEKSCYDDVILCLFINWKNKGWWVSLCVFDSCGGIVRFRLFSHRFTVCTTRWSLCNVRCSTSKQHMTILTLGCTVSCSHPGDGNASGHWSCQVLRLHCCPHLIFSYDGETRIRSWFVESGKCA